MKVGSFGNVAFIVSPEKIETPRDISRQGSVDIQSHKRHLNTDLPEFTGVGLETASFNIRLSAYLGVTDPQGELDKLTEYMRTGTPKYLILGGKIFGRHKWLINKYKQTAEHHDKRGEIVSMDVSVTLTEYPKE